MSATAKVIVWSLISITAFLVSHIPAQRYGWSEVDEALFAAFFVVAWFVHRKRRSVVRDPADTQESPPSQPVPTRSPLVLLFVIYCVSRVQIIPLGFGGLMFAAICLMVVGWGVAVSLTLGTRASLDAPLYWLWADVGIIAAAFGYWHGIPMMLDW